MVASKANIRRAEWLEKSFELNVNVPKWFEPELFESVLERLGEGDTMRTISKEMGFSKGTFWRICDENPSLADRYARARDVQAHDHFERIIDLAKQVENGEIDPQAAKVAIDARKWAACKLMPRKYGDKIEIEAKTTHELGDSVMGMLNAIRVERAAALAEPEQGTVIDAYVVSDTQLQPPIEPASDAPKATEEAW